MMGLFAISQSWSNEADSALNANELMRQVVANELQAEQNDHSLWRYREVRRHGSTRQQFEYVDTPQGTIHWLLGQNGHALNLVEQRKEDSRIQELISQPQIFQKRAEDAKHDTQEEETLLNMLGDGFLYHKVAEENGLVKLDFVPNPEFHPQHHEGDVFHHMVGTIWVDPNQKRIAKMQGTLTGEVKFGFGILGHLSKGGTFMLEQKNLGGGHWEMNRLKVTMSGKALFMKTITVHEDRAMWDFKPVSRETTPAQAEQVLKQDASSAPLPPPAGF